MILAQSTAFKLNLAISQDLRHHADATVLAETTGPSKRTLTVPVAAGAQRVTVSAGGSTASYAATITSPN